MSRPALFALILTFGVLSACTREPDHPAPAPSAAEAMVTDRVDINAGVRRNLGITFARVESRHVARTLRVPGRFELLPTARREYRVPAAGKVELLVHQYQRVEIGTPLYRLDSPSWRDLQRELTDAEAAVKLAQAGVDSIGPFMEAHEKHHTEIQSAVAVWTERVRALEHLQAAGGARGDEVSQARATLASVRADFAETLEKEAELQARQREVRAQLDSARSRAAILLASAASLTGRPVEELSSSDDGGPRWRTISQIEVAALSPGVLDGLHAISGSLVELGSAVVTTVEPDQVRFRASALQSDLGRLADGLPAVVVAPRGGSAPLGTSVVGTLRLAPTADPDRRTIELVMTPRPDGPLPAWVRAGVSAFLEIVVSGSSAPELAIPLACVARDGTRTIIFRRDPSNPERAIRLEADLGIDDGRWVVVRSGVAEGDEVVLDGVYQLMVATSGTAAKGGHFHPDGTFHEGDE